MLENAILEHAKAINNLADALRGVGQVPLKFHTSVEAPAGVTTEAVAASVEKAIKPKKEEPTGPFYWKDAETNFFGKESTKKALDKMLGEKKSIVVIEEAEYKTLEAELRERNAKAAEKMKSETSAEKPAEVPTVEDVIAVFTKYLPKDLDAEERKARHAFVKPLLQRFGVEKATLLLPEHRAEAIALVERKMAGEDIDPSKANFDDEALV